MKTIALRFGEQFSPECGTIMAHQKLIDELGYVWYGKMGNPISDKVIKEIMKGEGTKVLFIQSGEPNRYWAYVSEITKKTPPLNGIPEYYRNKADRFKTWLKITKFELAPKNIMSKCRVISSGASLSVTSRHSMSPYFIIEVQNNV